MAAGGARPLREGLSRSQSPEITISRPLTAGSPRAQVFLEEEREAEVEAALDASLEKTQQAAEAEEEEAAALGVDGRSEGGAGAAGRRTAESVRGAERVLEALPHCSVERWVAGGARPEQAGGLGPQ